MVTHGSRRRPIVLGNKKPNGCEINRLRLHYIACIAPVVQALGNRHVDSRVYPACCIISDWVGLPHFPFNLPFAGSGIRRVILSGRIADLLALGKGPRLHCRQFDSRGMLKPEDLRGNMSLDTDTQPVV